MSAIIKEPFSPRRRHLMIDFIGMRSGISSFYRRLQRSSLEDACMVVLLLFLLFTTLLLPWIVL